MLLSERTIDLLDDGKLDELINGSEFSREKFLKGGGALVVGFSLVGSALAGSAKGATARVAAAGPPNAAFVDSWVAIHADNTATIAVGKIDITGAPTGLLQIAAEELDLTIQQVKLAAVEYRHLAEPGPHRRLELDLERRPAGTPGSGRGAGGPARPCGEAARRPRLRPPGPGRRRQFEERPDEEGDLWRPPGRQAVFGAEHGPGAAEAGD